MGKSFSKEAIRRRRQNRTKENGDPQQKENSSTTNTEKNNNVCGEVVDCVCYRKQHKNVSMCAMCSRSISANNEQKTKLSAVGEVCVLPKSGGGRCLGFGKKRTNDVSAAELPFCARCPYTYFCNFCHEILRGMQQDCLKSRQTCEALGCGDAPTTTAADPFSSTSSDNASSSSSSRRHPWCIRCCPISQDAALERLKELGKKLGWVADEAEEKKKERWGGSKKPNGRDDDCAVVTPKVRNHSFIEWDDCDYDLVTRHIDDALLPENSTAATTSELSSSVANQSSSAFFKIADVDELVLELQEHPDRATTWFNLGAAMFPTQFVDINDDHQHLDKIDCLVMAINLSPNNARFITELLVHCPKTRRFKIQGHEKSNVDMAVRLVEVNPTNATAWRNLGFMMSHDSVVREVAGVSDCTRQCALRMSCKYATTELEIVASAYAMGSCSDGRLIFRDNENATREEIIRTFLDELDENQCLIESVESMMGQIFVTQVLSELSLLFHDHPRVLKVASGYHVTDKVIGSGAYGQVREAYFVDYSNDDNTPLEQLDDTKKEKLAAKIVTYDPCINSINKNQEMMLMTCARFRAYITRCDYIHFDPATKKATMFLEYAPHGSLHHMITAQGHRFHERTIRTIFAQLLICLSHMHDYNVVHQDIKPQNILGFEDGVVKLADFGVSCNLSCAKYMATVGGTESYMPPEALNLDVVSTAGDLWSLGVTMVELACGTQTIPDPEHVEDAEAEPPYRPYIPDHLSEPLKKILRRCLDSNHETRITAKEALATLYFKEPLQPEIEALFEPLEVFDAAKHNSGIPQDVLDGTIYTQGGLTGDGMTMQRTNGRNQDAVESL